MYLWLLIGIPLPTLCGWLLLRVIEGTTPVLNALERWVAGFIVGSIFVPFLFFLVDASGVGLLTLPWMLGVQLVVILLLVIRYALYERRNTISLPRITHHESLFWKPWEKLLAAALGVWFILKVIAMWILLIGPAYFDDTLKNWNLRGKMFYEQGHIIVEPGIGSYPPTVPLMKTWLASLSGWHEGLVNSIHILWFLAALFLLFSVLRRYMNTKWALVGTYLLSTTPLYALHGGIAYADQFLSVVVFLAVSWLLLGHKEHTFLRLSALATGLLIFTKNEALLLYVPPIALIALIRLGKQQKSALLWYIGFGLAIALPWLLFKWSHHLDFGNAKPISGMALSWHAGVLETIFRNTFFMGHFALLPALFVASLVLGWKTVFGTPLRVAVAFLFVVLFGQVCIFVFTDLATEALNQTGYARGVLHLVPVMVFITTVCLQSVCDKES